MVDWLGLNAFRLVPCATMAMLLALALVLPLHNLQSEHVTSLALLSALAGHSISVGSSAALPSLVQSVTGITLKVRRPCWCACFASVRVSALTIIRVSVGIMSCWCVYAV